MEYKADSGDVKDFKSLQETTHYRLCESIHKLTERVEQRLESIESKLERLIQDRGEELN
jgi:hypothetical protein